MVDRFFDYLNVKSPNMAQLKRKDSIAPYKSPRDERFKVGVPSYTMVINTKIISMHVYTLQWLVDVFLKYLDEWEDEAASHEELSKTEQRRMYLSRETLLVLQITGEIPVH